MESSFGAVGNGAIWLLWMALFGAVAWFAWVYLAALYRRPSRRNRRRVGATVAILVAAGFCGLFFLILALMRFADFSPAAARDSVRSWIR